ncbi:MAG: helix-turn-helix transcriptional regulator [Bdellovibrionota bacterium]
MDQTSFLELGKYLREKRLSKKLTQVQVAKSLGYTSQFIANWERGVSSPPLEVLRQVIDMYSINLRDFSHTINEIQQDYWKRNIFSKKSKNKNK